eukprot:1322416-Ditylum_brightwellii.AAC.1
MLLRVTNIKDVKDDLLELTTNGRMLESNQECDVEHLGTQWFNKDAITNIIRLTCMAEYPSCMANSQYQPYLVLRVNCLAL